MDGGQLEGRAFARCDSYNSPDAGEKNGNILHCPLDSGIPIPVEEREDRGSGLGVADLAPTTVRRASLRRTTATTARRLPSATGPDDGEQNFCSKRFENRPFSSGSRLAIRCRLRTFDFLPPAGARPRPRPAVPPIAGPSVQFVSLRCGVSSTGDLLSAYRCWPASLTAGPATVAYFHSTWLFGLGPVGSATWSPVLPRGRWKAHKLTFPFAGPADMLSPCSFPFPGVEVGFDGSCVDPLDGDGVVSTGVATPDALEGVYAVLGSDGADARGPGRRNLNESQGRKDG
ncbi:hypothetical protein AXG93_2153s1080 [Marchantia polymorpha subsp. ruderalis]|uniref:Uncharacterized protein n=1 Tax=Marchantia polymorpha subsp. ruderalis TaxID=1480154 RepID=A0A176WI24_MARPO|nr:hypothetical protein AXG93_2153s1080 [Marchantia polymorpha subsp. ruderalis]